MPDDVAQYLNDAVLQGAEQFRKKKETAMLVIMFIDMVHSTEMREAMGEIQFEELRRTKKQEFTAIIEQEKHGEVIKDTGDGLLSVFAIPDVAVRRALDIQKNLVEHPTFQVRIGLDMGQVTREWEGGIVKDVFGRHVNRAARLEALSEGGHVLVSYPVWDSAKGWLKHFEQILWKKHGSYLLKGLVEPQIVFEPYDNSMTKPLKTLQGQRVNPEEELTYCSLCGRYVKLKDTFTCHICGTAGICVQYCYDAKQRQCIECAAKTITQDMPDMRSITPAAVRQFSPDELPSPEFNVLLSCASEDDAFVRHLAEYLRHEGLTVWLEDEQLDIGAQVLETIEQGLRCSQFIVVCLSKHFTNSIWGRAEYSSLLQCETKARSCCILPVIVGDYEEVDIPDFLYDKYCVDVRVKQGLERLLRKLRIGNPYTVSDQETEPQSYELPEEIQTKLVDLQNTILSFARHDAIHDALVFEFDKAGIQLLTLLERYPVYLDAFHEVLTEYQTVAERLFLEVHDAEYRRVLMFRFKKVEQAIEDLAGGFSSGESFLGEASDELVTASPYNFYEAGELDELEIEEWLKKLLSGKELEESEGIHWLLKAGVAKAEQRLKQIETLRLTDAVCAVLWKRAPRIMLHYHDAFWPVLKYMFAQNAIKWKLRFYVLKFFLKRSLSPEQASDLLHNFIPEDQQILSAFLMLHPCHECRQIAIEYLPCQDRWDIMLCPKTPLLIVKELVVRSCQDTSDSYMKALFLLLRPRLLAVNSPLAIGETYTMLLQFYRKPLFLEETFFHALIDLHQQIKQKAEAYPATHALEQQLSQSFQAFCSKEMLRDVDVAEMRHIPLPIQRKLAHDGYLPKFFICNSRDLIALESVRHVEKRPDVLKFLRLRPINGRALEKLAENDLLMKEYANRAAFCRNPKANPVLLRRYLHSLTHFDLKEIARDHNVSNFARELAAKYLSHYQNGKGH